MAKWFRSNADWIGSSRHAAKTVRDKRLSPKRRRIVDALEASSVALTIQELREVGGGCLSSYSLLLSVMVMDGLVLRRTFDGTRFYALRISQFSTQEAKEQERTQWQKAHVALVKTRQTLRESQTSQRVAFAPDTTSSTS